LNSLYISFFKGGKHVDHIIDQIVNIIKPLVDPNLKNGIKKIVIKNHLCVFVNALIENPAFSSQTKDILTTSVSDFGSKCVVDVTTVKEWAERSGLVEELMSDALAREALFCEYGFWFLGNSQDQGKMIPSVAFFLFYAAHESFFKGRPARKRKKVTVVEDLSDIVKLEDANWAGDGDRSEECRLLITEGE
ncbi:DNA topoisomerase II, partial [Cooperia oncophora]